MKWLGLIAVLVLASIWGLPALADESQRRIPAAQLSEWEIILDAEASPAECYAARELQRLLEASTKADIPIQTRTTWRKHRFYVGASAALGHRRVRVNADDLGEEEFVIRTGRRHVAIVGGRPRGTLYGVYHFAEAILGVRFLTADHTHIPERHELVLSRGAIGYAPPFSFRWSFYKELLDAPDFAARLRNNATTREARLGGVTEQPLIQHSMHRLVPVSTVGAVHPEYFALVGGHRALRAPRDEPQVCSTNPRVIDLVTQAVLDEIAAHPDRRVVSVSANDNDWYCECPECSAINEREGSPMGAHLHLVNAVAERVALVHPGVRIGTLAYWHTRRPPKHMRPRPNVQIQLCSFEHCPLHALDDPACPPNADFCRDLDGWRAICDDIQVWHYIAGLHHLDQPFANLHALGRSIRYLRDQRVRGLFLQGNGRCPAGEWSDLRNYVASRLMWNPDRDAMALVDEFLALHYGPSAKPLRECLDVVHEAAVRSGGHPTIFSGPRAWGLDAGTSGRLMALFDEALELAPDETVRARVEKASLCAYKAIIEAGGRLAYANGRIRLTYPAEMQARVAAYPELCAKLGMDRSSEFVPIAGYLDDIARNRAGAPAVRLENDLWRLTLAPAMNGVVVDMFHKPSGRNLLNAYDAPGINLSNGVLREDGPFPEPVAGPLAFEWESSGDSVTLRKTLSDGSLLARTITLGTPAEPAIRFETRLEYRGNAQAPVQFRVAPEFATGPRGSAGDLSVQVLDRQWHSVGLRPAREASGDEVPLDRARQGVSFRNPTTGLGVCVRYGDGVFGSPSLSWRRELDQVELELITLPVVLQRGETFTFHYQVDSISAGSASK